MELNEMLEETQEKLGVKFVFCVEEREYIANKKQYEKDDVTLFKFSRRNKIYVSAIEGTDKNAENYALLLPAYFDSFDSKRLELSKSEFLIKILLGECSSTEIYKYMVKYSVKNSPCFVIAISSDELSQEVMTLLTQYSGNSMDTAVRIDETNCLLVKFMGAEDDEYRSPTDYANFMAESLKEELGVIITAGIGATVKTFEDVSISYAQAVGALRYVSVFSPEGGIHSYKEYMLVKLLEDLPESRRKEYFSDQADEGAKEIFEDEEMLLTAEEFLKNSLNVSETSRKLYMHRNTLLYRLDKIQKSTGLNIREFSDAISFRVLNILYKLLKK